MDSLEEMKKTFDLFKVSINKKKETDPYKAQYKKGFVKGAMVKIYNKTEPKGYLNLNGKPSVKKQNGVWYTERIEGLHGDEEKIASFLTWEDEIYVTFEGFTPGSYVNVKCLKLLK